MLKNCTRCGEEKDLLEFYKNRNSCKKCVLELWIVYRMKNKDKIQQYKKEYRQRNKNKIRKYNKQYIRKCAEYDKDKMEKIRESRKKYYLKNRDKIYQIKKIYRKINKNKLNRYARKYREKRMKIDPIYVLIKRIRNRNRQFIKSKNLFKTKHFVDYIGCSGEELKIHLEKQFQDGMTWENINKWHLDHIVPISTAKTIEDVYKLNHYTNLQPLWAEDNLKKRNKLNWKPEKNLDNN